MKRLLPAPLLSACLVVLWFMHLKSEGRGLQLMVLLVFVLLAIFIGFTFFDTAYR